jgi:hypothetical protein
VAPPSFPPGVKSVSGRGYGGRGGAVDQPRPDRGPRLPRRDFFFTINGVRRTFEDHQPIVEGTDFMPARANATIPGYLSEGQKEFLIHDGTYRPDRTVNPETAHRPAGTGPGRSVPDRSLSRQRPRPMTGSHDHM